MRNKVEFSKIAIDDLEELYNYIYLNNFDDNIANNFITNIITYCEILINNPEIGKELYLNNVKTKYRYLVYKKYMIFYNLKNNTEIINRIISSRRDYIKVLFGEQL